MLELGVLADVAAATSTTMILFTSTSACIVYANFGAIPQDYGAALLVLGALGATVGQLATYWVVKALGRRSVIVFLMATLVGGGAFEGVCQVDLGAWAVAFQRVGVKWWELCDVSCYRRPLWLKHHIAPPLAPLQ